MILGKTNRARPFLFPGIAVVLGLSLAPILKWRAETLRQVAHVDNDTRIKRMQDLIRGIKMELAGEPQTTPEAKAEYEEAIRAKKQAGDAEFWMGEHLKAAHRYDLASRVLPWVGVGIGVTAATRALRARRAHLRDDAGIPKG